MRSSFWLFPSLALLGAWLFGKFVLEFIPDPLSLLKKVFGIGIGRPKLHRAPQNRDHVDDAMAAAR